jgi:(E)-4-hydroxy-3-methylbut-2-enyl-diphosphate synthase
MRYFHCGFELFNYTPRKSHEVVVGNRPIGGGNPIRLQSMTTTATTDTEGSVAQCRAIIEAGGDIVRLTTQGTIEARALEPIRKALNEQGFNQPLVADVHFNPNVADVAATIVEKVE